MAEQLQFTTFDYNDVRLVPAKCIINSRSEIDTSLHLGKRKFNIPVVPANMSTIIDENLAKWLAKNDYFYIMHRFDIDPIAFTEEFQKSGLYASISIGIKDADYDYVDEFVKKNLTPEYITVDVAHGHSASVIKMIKYIKKNLPETFLIAGNVGTGEAAKDLEKAGADAIKVGIGPGSACITSPNTGFGTRDWQLSAVQDAFNSVSDAVIIADGGIREYGDIAKSLAFGATFVMVGGMFGGHDENPGEIVENENGEQFKVFFGSASEHQKGEPKHVEGKKMLVPCKGPISETMRATMEHLQSAVSYAGGKELMDLRDSKYVIVR
ncbi:MAG: GMP reductase [Micrococcaceae bacterium]